MLLQLVILNIFMYVSIVDCVTQNAPLT